MSDAMDFLTDKNGEQSKSKKTVAIVLIMSIVVIVLFVVLRNAASAATSSGGGTSGGGSGGTTTTGTSGPDYAGELSYQKGLADIQNEQATLSESLQEKLLASKTANAEGLATFNSGLQQTNTMNYINDLIYGEKQQFTEQTSEQQQTVSNAGTLLKDWYNTLTGTKVANGQTLLDVMGGWGGERQNATTNAVESTIFNGFNFTGKGGATGTANSNTSSNPFSDFFKNFNPTAIQATVQ